MKPLLCQAFLAITMLCVPLAQAAISLSHTRLIVSATQPEASPRVINEGDQPVLLQIWFDTGVREADLQSISVPFLVLPPILRLEPGATQRLRIMYTGNDGLPADRESVYWLNILEIPPKDERAQADLLQISFRTRVKLFFRPEGVQVDDNVHEALRFELHQQGRQQVLRITNPTPVHQTLLDVVIGQSRDDPSAQVLPPPDMLKPKESVDLPLAAGWAGHGAGIQVMYSVIDDYGKVVNGTRDVTGLSSLP